MAIPGCPARKRRFALTVRGAVETWEPGGEPDDGGAVLPAGGIGTSPRITTAFTGGELAGPTVIMGLLTLIGLGAVGLGRRHTVER